MRYCALCAVPEDEHVESLCRRMSDPGPFGMNYEFDHKFITFEELMKVHRDYALTPWRWTGRTLYLGRIDWFIN